MHVLKHCLSPPEDFVYEHKVVESLQTYFDGKVKKLVDIDNQITVELR